MTSIHPAADLFPMMSNEELKELADDIAANGLRIPLVYAGNVLIDGRNRLRACDIAGVQPISQELHGYSEAQILDYIVSANIRRRHLDAGQKAMVATALEPMYAEAAKERMLAGKKDPTENLPEGSRHENESREKAAKAVGVSGKSVSTAKALKRDTPDLAAKVAAGEMTLNAADKERKARATKVDPIDTFLLTLIADGYEHDLNEEGRTKLTGMVLAATGIKRSHGTLEQRWDRLGGLTSRRNSAPIDTSGLSKTATKTLEAAKRSAIKQLEKDYAVKLLAEVDQLKAEAAQAVSDYKAKVEAEAKVEREERNQERERYKIGLASIRAKGVIALGDYKLIKSCLHPDSRASVSDEKLAAAFRIFNDPKIEMLLVKGDK